METEYDDNWEPPSEAMMKLLQARRERSDRISKLMGDYLLKGYKMLGTTCPQCDTILLETKQGTKYCIACSELDSDADKDDPVTSQTAALAQARERGVREDSCRPPAAPSSPAPPSAATTTLPPPASVRPVQGPASIQSTAVSHLQALSSHPVSQLPASSPVQPYPRMSNLVMANESANASSGSMGEGEKYVRVLLDKMDWASGELRESQSVEYSIQVCQLIKGCADTLSSIKAAWSLPRN